MIGRGGGEAGGGYGGWGEEGGGGRGVGMVLLECLVELW